MFLFHINKSHKNLFELILTTRLEYMTRHKNSIPHFDLSLIILQIFFPSAIIKRNNLDSNIKILVLFKKRMLTFIKRNTNGIFHCLNPKSLKLVTRLKLRLSQYRCYKLKHRFQDTLNPICICGTAETTVYYRLHCPNFSFQMIH